MLNKELCGRFARRPSRCFMELLRHTPASRRLEDFLNEVAGWPASRWRIVLLSSEQPSFRKRCEVAIALRDAIIERERLVFMTWRATDGCRTVMELLPVTLRTSERERIARLLREAALALATLPALPRAELDLLLLPFLPLSHANDDAPYA